MNSRNSLQHFKSSWREVWVSSLLSHIREILVVFFLRLSDFTFHKLLKLFWKDPLKAITQTMVSFHLHLLTALRQLSPRHSPICTCATSWRIRRWLVPSQKTKTQTGYTPDTYPCCTGTGTSTNSAYPCFRGIKTRTYALLAAKIGDQDTDYCKSHKDAMNSVNTCSKEILLS